VGFSEDTPEGILSWRKKMGKKRDKHRYNVSLYILIPIIFSGMSVLTGIIAFQFSKYYPKGGKLLSGEIAVWAVVVIGVTFLCGFIITRLILSPMRKFVEQAEKMPFFSKSLAERKSLNVNEIDHFNLVFKEVTSLLDKVEAKQLFPEIIGQSRVMRGLFSQIIKVALTDTTVLIMGDSGTGRELIATSIHNHSPRKDKPFVKLSCVAIPESLLESELFGHEKGAFTGATSQRIGKFELANEGTILLDEIGDMPMETQAKLLRVLQGREFERVGGTRPIKVDVRFISASNKDLPEMVKEGKFREDLYYLINAVTLLLPRLAERREDIPLLIDYFLEKAPEKARISSDALQMLMNYSWPGNVRELQNTVERMALMSEGGIIEPANIPADILLSMKEVGYGLDKSRELGDIVSIDDRLGNLEKKMIVEALISTRGVQARAAELLGINERSLYHRIKKHEIDISSLKP
jgi:transcriptional regulator with GAF, ATPase, and Fis domain